jgi:hypothetical protein
MAAVVGNAVGDDASRSNRSSAWVSRSNTHAQRRRRRYPPHMGPARRPHPTVLLGGAAAPALRRAGRLAQGWISSSRHDLTRIGTCVETMRDGARETARNPAAVRIVVPRPHRPGPRSTFEPRSRPSQFVGRPPSSTCGQACRSPPAPKSWRRLTCGMTDELAQLPTDTLALSSEVAQAVSGISPDRGRVTIESICPDEFELAQPRSASVGAPGAGSGRRSLVGDRSPSAARR